MFDFLYNPKGRISRKGYLLGYLLPYLAISFVLGLLGAVPLVGIVSVVVSLFYFWPGLVAVPVRRFHDRGHSGWWHAGILVAAMVCGGLAFGPVIGEIAAAPEAFAMRMDELTDEEQTAYMWSMLFGDGRARLFLLLAIGLQLGEFLYFAIMPGERGPNRFGNDPLTGGRGFAD